MSQLDPAQALERRDIVIAVASTVISAALIVPFAPLGIDHHHDGIMLKPALDVADGQVLFRDSFSQYGPLTTFIHASVLVVSPTLLALRYLTVLLDAAALGIFFLVWRHVLPRCLAVLAAAIFVILNPVFDGDSILFSWSSDTAMLFQAIAWLAMLRVLASREPRPWSVVLGLSAVAAFWCRQPVGVILVATVCCIFAGCGLAGWKPRGGRWVEIIWLTGLAALAGTASMVGYLAWHGAIGAWWYQNIEWPRRWVEDGSNDYWWAGWRGHSLDPSKGSLLGLLVLLATGMGWVARRLGRGEGTAEWIPSVAVIAAATLAVPLSPGFLAVHGGGWGLVLSGAVAGLAVVRVIGLVPALLPLRCPDFIPSAALAGLSLASLAQLYPVPCQRHLYWAVGPALGAAVYGLWRFSGLSARVTALLLAMAFIPAACDTVRRGSASLGRETTTLVTPAVLRGIRVDHLEAAFLRRGDDALRRMQQADPNRCFVMIGDDALFLTFVDNRKNLSPFYVTWTAATPPAAAAARNDAVKTQRPFLLLQRVTATSRDAFCVNRRYALVADFPDQQLALIAPVEVAARLRR